MEETERAPISERLLQGDILQLVDEKAEFDFNLAMIINADCDMQSSKHDGVIAILPIYTFQQYLRKFWLNSFLLGKRNEAIAVIRSALDIKNEHIDDLQSWIASDGTNVLKKGAEKIFAAYSPSAKQMRKLDDALIRLNDSMICEKESKLSSVSKFAPSDKDKEKYCREQIIDAKKRMGDDHFFITEIKNDDSVGYVVRMRRIYSLPADVCFNSNSALQSANVSGASAYRICRLTPHYKFKAAQLFAYQYSRIGLPDDVTALSELAISDMAFHFQGDQ